MDAVLVELADSNRPRVTGLPSLTDGLVNWQRVADLASMTSDNRPSANTTCVSLLHWHNITLANPMMYPILPLLPTTRGLAIWLIAIVFRDVVDLIYPM